MKYTTNGYLMAVNNRLLSLANTRNEDSRMRQKFIPQMSRFLPMARSSIVRHGFSDLAEEWIEKGYIENVQEIESIV